MKVQFELTIGENRFTLIEEVETNADFFKKLHFYSTLPKVGPNGETDLVLTYRVAQKQYEYYSIVSQKAQQEFRFGQSKESKGQLFAKGWEALFVGEDEASEGASAGIGGGIGAPAPAAAPQAAAPTAHTGIGAPAAKTPAPAPAAKTQAPAPAAAKTQAPTPPPATQAQAQSILAKFGI